MRGLMMDRPLLLSSLIDYAADRFPGQKIVSRRLEGDLHRYSYSEARARVAQLANALKDLGIGEGDRIATLAWNSYRHFELYHAISGIGAICHTLNPRLSPENLIYIINHAEDRLLFVDVSFLGLVKAIVGQLPKLEKVVLLADETPGPALGGIETLAYETLIAGQADSIDWPTFDENTAAGLCYTSGTTGHPKGVLYSHRSNLLHALCVAASDGLKLGSDQNILPVVPLFHVNAWGLPYIAPLTGAALTFPGASLGGADLFELMESEGVTTAWGVPTVWLALLDEMQKRGAKPSALESLVVGGAAPPAAMISALEADFGINVVQGWGMTETSPVATLSTLDGFGAPPSDEERSALKCKQGRRVYQVEMKVVGGDGAPLPHDGNSTGELLVRGPFIATGYYRDETDGRDHMAEGGWLRTGDVASISPDGFMRIVDRSKDLIKSGGEWISSIELENHAMAHPAVAEAAAIALKDAKWGERPLLVLVRRPDSQLEASEIHDFLAARVMKWWLPVQVVFVEEIPHTATGKVSKRLLRQQMRERGLAVTGAA